MAESVLVPLFEGWGASATVATVAAYATVITASAIVSQQLNSQALGGSLSSQANPGSRAQVPPAGSNKLPVVYGSAYVGGIITDLSITEDNQNLYYVIALSEVTNTESGGTPDTITFGNIYWGGKLCNFDGTDHTRVVSLLDESTGIVDTSVNGKLFFYTYNNGSNSGTNTSLSAIQVMQASGLTYQWDGDKLMSNCAFAIVKLVYSQTASLTGLSQTRFQLTNSRTDIGDCFLDYMTSTRYGAAIPLAQINTASLTALNAYGNEVVTFHEYNGSTATQARFKFDGTVDTTQTIMQNLQIMSACCDCLLKYNEIKSEWGVVIQKNSTDVVMDINDSNMVSSISVTPMDVSNSYNIVECKYPDGTVKDSFNSVTYDLAQIDPSLLFNNEPVNKQSINLNLVNNDVRVQLLANRFLKAAREDLQIQCQTNYSGIQLEAGDVVTVTNANYGWTAKPFRVIKVTEIYGGDGNITAQLNLTEYNATVYSDADVTQFVPTDNTGIGDPTFFGSVYAPSVTTTAPFANVPYFGVQVTCSSNGITQYAEVWYSAYSNPTSSQLFFAGTTDVNPGGNPYTPGAVMGVVNLYNIPNGTWYFFVRMVNNLASSIYSPASSSFNWKPTTFQYTNRYLAIAYADNADGTSGFSYSPRGKAYYGLFNNTTANGGTNPALYTWYQATTSFGSANYLLYTNRQNRKFSFNVGNAGYLNLGGAFVPSDTSMYDSTQWSGLLDPNGSNQSFIDLDLRTGQVTVAGATGNNLNDGFLAVTNNTDGSMKVNLHDFLNFGAGIYTKSFNAATLTIDIYGRVVGFTEADEFFYTETVFNATAGQTSFTFSHTVGWALVFRDGVLLDPNEYTETSSTVVMNTSCAANEKVVLIYMRGVSTSEYYEPLNITIASNTTNTVTYSGLPWNQVAAGDKITFSNTGTPTQYTVSSVDQTTKVITFTGIISGATAGLSLYRYRAAGANYAPFTRYDTDVSSITSYAPTTWEVNNGFESIYVNGCQISEIDYNIDNGTNAISGFPSVLTGKLTVLMYTQNNLAVPASNIANTVAYTTSGQTTYPFASNPLSMEVYANGCLLTKGSGYDYTASASNYILTTAYNNNSTLLNQQTFARMGAA